MARRSSRSSGGGGRSGSIVAAHINWRIDPTSEYYGRFKKAQEALDHAVIRDSEPYVPYDTGRTTESAPKFSEIGSGRIVYKTPYVIKIYYGYDINFHTDKHPLATFQWVEKAKAVHLWDWVEEIGAEIRMD